MAGSGFIPPLPHFLQPNEVSELVSEKQHGLIYEEGEGEKLVRLFMPLWNER